MKKFVKYLLCLALVAMLCFVPAVVKQGPGTPGGPGPDDRPIGYIIMVSSVKPTTK